MNRVVGSVLFRAGLVAVLLTVAFSFIPSTPSTGARGQDISDWWLAERDKSGLRQAVEGRLRWLGVI